jgi:D-glutamate cyclase
MRGLDVTDHTAPLDWLFVEAANRSIRTIGVGDGGNEVGMLNLLPFIQKHVPNGPILASSIGCDFLLSAGCVHFKSETKR